MTAARSPRGIGRIFGRRKDQPTSPTASTPAPVAPPVPAPVTTPKPPVAKAPAKKAPAAKPPAAKSTTKTAAPAKKAPAATALAATAPVKKAPVKKAPAKKAPAATALAATAPAKKAPAKPVPVAVATTQAPAKQASAKQPPTKPAPAKKPAARPAAAPSGPLTGADAWTKAELTAMRTALDGQALELRSEIDDAEVMVESLKRAASAESSGDEADAGTKTFEREHEMSLVNNSRDLLLQTERALARLTEGSYGRCEDCGKPIPKARLQAAPRATLCVTCKQREERR